MQKTGLVCPLCGSWYSTDGSALALGLSAGDECGNQSMVGHNPEKCSPSHPCKGRLAPDTRGEEDE